MRGSGCNRHPQNVGVSAERPVAIIFDDEIDDAIDGDILCCWTYRKVRAVSAWLSYQRTLALSKRKFLCVVHSCCLGPCSKSYERAASNFRAVQLI